MGHPVSILNEPEESPRSPGGDEIVYAPRVAFRMPRPVLRRTRYTSSEKWVITNMCPARLSQVTPCGESPLKQNIFEQAFIWRAIQHSSPNTTRNIKLLNSDRDHTTQGRGHLFCACATSGVRAAATARYCKVKTNKC